MEKNIVPDRGIKLTKQDKRITISQKGVTIRHENKPVDSEIIGSVYLLIDCSSSMDVEEKLNHAKNGAAKFAMEAKTKGYLVGLIQFDSSATHLCEPQKELSVLHQHLRSMEASGNTNMTDAILLATEKLMNKKGARVMVVATDGVPDNPDSALEAGQQAKKSGIEIITIGTDDADRDFLRKLASRPEFGTKVSSVQLEQAIASVAKMLLSKRGG